MHRKNAHRGLAVVTVSLDDDQEKVDAANVFLRKEKSPFINLLLDEPHGIWSKKLGFTIPPCYFVFDRQGKWVRLTGDVFDENELPKELDKVILRMLDEK